MRVSGVAVAGLVAVAGVLLSGTGAYAEDDGKKEEGPRPLIGDVIIFNDEIVEPVSLPLSTCGGLVPILSKSPGTTCEGASRVSDDDA
jgi:hypothetical protein